jgi:hypothetical protein
MTVSWKLDQTNRDYYGGTLMLVIGVAAAAQGTSYRVGSLSQMGPGFFPTALGVLLALVGAVIAATAHRGRTAAPDTPRAPEWRGWLCITFSIVAFIVLGRYGGLIPSTFAVVFISAMGDRQNTFKKALLLALAMVAICIVVFWWALRMQFPLFRWG